MPNRENQVRNVRTEDGGDGGGVVYGGWVEGEGHGGLIGILERVYALIAYTIRSLKMDLLLSL